MNAKEKALELFYLMYNSMAPLFGRYVIAKKQSLITIDQIIDATTKRWGGINPETRVEINNVEVNPYWGEVKQELEKL